MNNPKFTIFTGSMFSGKSTRLLMMFERYRYQKRNILIFKPVIDDRRVLGEIKTHCGWATEACPIKTGQDILDAVAMEPDVINVVVLDEAFMIPGSADALIWLFKQGVDIVVSTLDISATGKVFTEVRDMFPWATQVVKCSAICTVCGADAHYTHRKLLDGDEIQIGGEELYEPRCFTHHVIINERNK